jgi:Tfp pilus assembly PilM family ATPase
MVEALTEHLGRVVETLGLTGAGLVLREQGIEVFQATRNLQGVRLSRVLAAPIPEGSASAPQIIARLLAEARIATSRLSVSVASPDILLRSFTLPPLPKAEWASAVQFEARKHIPFRPEDLVWDFHATENKLTRQLDVVFVAMRAETFGRIQGWLRSASITPTVIEPQAVSLARWTIFGDKAATGQFACMVDVEPQGAHIVIAKDQVPYFTRDVRFNVRGIDPASPGMKGLDAERPEPSPGDVPSPDPRAETLVSELRLSLDFFTRENPSASIGRLWMFGDEGTVASWCPWISRQLGTPIEMARVPAASLGQLPSLRFACSAGLALRRAPAARVKLNFEARGASSVAAAAAAPARTPQGAEAAVRRLLGPIAKPLAIQVAVAVAFLGVLKLMSDQHLESVRRQQQAVIHGFPDVGWRLTGKSKQALQALQKDADRRLSFLRKTIQGRLSVAEHLEALARTLPDGVWLEGVNFTSRSDQERGLGQTRLVIQGSCYLKDGEQELGAIREFAHRLKEQPDSAVFGTAEVAEIMSMNDRAAQVAYKRFRLDCGAGKP